MTEKTIDTNGYAHNANGIAGDGCFVLPVNDAFLVYAPLCGTAALINRSALNALRSHMAAPVSDRSLSAELNELTALLLAAPAKQPVIEGPLNPLFLGLLPTRRCNCRCVYCDFESDDESASDMPPALAEAALAWYADFLSQAGYDHMEVHFFGGEPLICRELVETTIRHSRLLAKRHGFSLHLEVSTNGIIDEEYARFVGDHFHTVILSLDGFQNIHDRHRPINSRHGSFATARRTASLLSQTQTELCLRCCVTTLNVQCLDQIAAWFCEEFRPAVINFEPLTNNAKARAAGLSPPDPYLFAGEFAKASAVAARYGVKTVYAATEGKPGKTTFCPVGKDALIVSPDGRVSSCYMPRKVWIERGLDMDVGRMKTDRRTGRQGIALDLDALARLRTMVLDKPRCERCFCRWVCSGGCHVQHSYPGSSSAYEPFCIQTRVLSVCRLLEDMDLPQIAQAFLADNKAMQALALQDSDCFNQTARSSPSACDMPVISESMSDAAVMPKSENERWSIPYIDQPLSFWQKIATRYGQKIQAVYLPLPQTMLPSGRPALRDRHRDIFLSHTPLPVSVLLNPVVLPRAAASMATSLLETLKELQDKTCLNGVTVTDISLARIIKERLPDLPLTASTLMDVAYPHQAAQLAGICDVLVPASRIMRNYPALQALQQAFSGSLRLIVNEGCLPDCLMRVQHFYEMGYAHGTPLSLCEPLLQEHPWMRLTGAWVLPQHLHCFDGLTNSFKLAGRATLQDPEHYLRVLDAYITRQPLTPDAIGGGPASPLEPVHISDAYYYETLHCDTHCHSCSVCREYYAQAAR